MEYEKKLHSEDFIFISYAHIDNKGVVEGHKGWVDAMHECLAQGLSEFLGKKPKIWRDPLLAPYENFNDALKDKISKIEILVAVLSPPYIESEECLKELRQFCARATGDGGIGLDCKARIFKVLKTPIDDTEYTEELKELLQGLLGYRFYEIDKSGRPRVYSQESNFDKFLLKLSDLAWDMTKFIKGHRQNISGSLWNPNGRTVYLAEVESDLEEKRDRIKRELLSHGHTVLPSKDLPRDVTRLERAVHEDLERSYLSLHLIGEHYGFIPDKERLRSSVRLQYELAAARSKIDSSFSQLIWMPRGLETQDERQKVFLEDLRLDAGNHPRTEVMQDKLEDLKKDLLDRLAILSSAPDKPRTEAPNVRDVVTPGIGSDLQEAYALRDPMRIYLICDGKDYDATEQLNNFLFDQNFEVVRSLHEGDSAQRLQDHDQQLSLCDVAIVFHGQTNEIWMRQKLLDLRKTAGNNPSRKLFARAVYLAPPITNQKKAFRTLEAKVVREDQEFPPKDLVGFLERVRGMATEDVARVKGVGR